LPSPHLFTMGALKIGGLKIEVVEVGADGSAKFRLWYEEWGGRYVDVEVAKQSIGGVDVYLGELRTGGFVRSEHLKRIFMILRSKRIQAILLGDTLYLTTHFRDAVLAMAGYVPRKSNEGVPIAYLGSYKFQVGDVVAEFTEGGVRRRNFYAKVELPTRRDAEELASRLASLGIPSYNIGRAVVMDRNALFGLLALTGASPPELYRLYSLPNFAVYARGIDGSIRYYFAAVVDGTWRSVLGSVSFGGRLVVGYHRDRHVASGIAKAVRQELGGGSAHSAFTFRSAGVYAVAVSRRVIARLLKGVAAEVQARPVSVHEDGSVELEGVGTLSASGNYIRVGSVELLLLLYKSLVAAGCRVALYPDGVKLVSVARSARAKCEA